MKRRTPGRKQPSLSFVGAGAVGSTLAILLHREGYPVRSIVSRTGPRAVALARSVASPRASTELADLDRRADIIIVAVQDSELGAVARSLAGLRSPGLRGRIVLHTSGVHDAGILARLRKAGALTGSFHPLQTFPPGASRPRPAASLRGICFGVDGDERALAAAGKIARDLGGRILPVPPELRALYHAAGVFASGYLAVVMHAVSTLSGAAGLGIPWTEAFGPLMTATMENTVRESAAAALTGPVTRGDLETVGLHLRALEEFAPEFLPLYTVAALEAGRIALGRGVLPRERYDELLAGFRAAIRAPKHR